MFKESIIGICLIVILILRYTSNGEGDKNLILSDTNKENLESLMEDKLNTCPRYSCQNDQFENLVFCHKSSIKDPFDVQIKDCNTFNLMSDSDFWGRPVNKQHKLGCHHGLNRCVQDPYIIKVDKNPGDTCINDYECKSKFCLSDNKSQLKYCAGKGENDVCSADDECIIGLYCGDSNKDKDDGVKINKCWNQKDLQSDCTRDEECKNNMGCANGKCWRYGGIFNGQISDNALVCQGGFIDRVFQNEEKRLPDYRCFGSPEIQVKHAENNTEGLNPYQCKSASDRCKYIATTPIRQEFDLKCKCGLSPNGHSYCPIIYQKGFTQNMAMIIDLFGSNCHTTDRHSIHKCYIKEALRIKRAYINDPKTLETLNAQIKMLNDFIIQKFKYEKFNLIQDTDKCMQQHSSISQYYEAIEALQEGKTIDDTLNNNHHIQHTIDSVLFQKSVENPYLLIVIGCLSLMIILNQLN